MYQQNTIYHGYNHTNNHELLFRGSRDYALFERKMKKHLLPVADILCYCLMPTHFHIQYLANSTGLESIGNQQKIHAAFRIMLSSYVRVINDRYERRGSLLRSKMNYKPAYDDFVPEDWEINDDTPFTMFIPYIKTCFRYIHNNPVKAGLVDSPELWLYSSAPDYAGLRDNGLCSFGLTEKLLGIRRIA